MARFKRFEDIPVWQAARALARDIYRVTRRTPFREDAGLVDQIRRAVVSVSSNIAEGHERGTTRDLILFLYYAKGSAGEVRSQLYIAEDAGYLTAAEGDGLRDQAADISRQIYAWVTSMQAPDFAAGPKYHKSRPAGVSRWEHHLQQFGIVRLPDGRYTMAEDLDDPQE